jgi:hypothetical protein
VPKNLVSSFSKTEVIKNPVWKKTHTKENKDDDKEEVAAEGKE